MAATAVDGAQSALPTRAPVPASSASATAGDDRIATEWDKACRSRGCEFTFSFGTLLRLPLRTIASACVFFHRFYLRHSFHLFDCTDVSVAALFLAGKTEDTPRRIADVVVQLVQFRENRLIEVEGPEFVEIRKKIFDNEAAILCAIEFNFTVQHPFEFVISALKKLFPCKTLLENTKGIYTELGYSAWKLVEDSFRSPECLRHRPQTLAVVAIFLASKYESVFVPSLSSQHHRTSQEWYEVMCPELSRPHCLEEICLAILEVATSPPGQTLRGPSSQHTKLIEALAKHREPQFDSSANPRKASGASHSSFPPSVSDSRKEVAGSKKRGFPELSKPMRSSSENLEPSSASNSAVTSSLSSSASTSALTSSSATTTSSSHCKSKSPINGRRSSLNSNNHHSHSSSKKDSFRSERNSSSHRNSRSPKRPRADHSNDAKAARGVAAEARSPGRSSYSPVAQPTDAETSTLAAAGASAGPGAASSAVPRSAKKDHRSDKRRPLSRSRSRDKTRSRKSRSSSRSRRALPSGSRSHRSRRSRSPSPSRSRTRSRSDSRSRSGRRSRYSHHHRHEDHSRRR